MFALGSKVTLERLQIWSVIYFATKLSFFEQKQGYF